MSYCQFVTGAMAGLDVIIVTAIGYNPIFVILIMFVIVICWLYFNCNFLCVRTPLFILLLYVIFPVTSMHYSSVQNSTNTQCNKQF